MGASYGKQRAAKAGKLDVGGGRWTPLPHKVIHSKEYRQLSHAARSLLFDIAAQYNGANNGKLVACAKYLRPLGWTSNETVTKALRALTAGGFLIQTRQGMRPPMAQAAWFAIGWLNLNITEGLDISPRSYRRSIFTPIEALKNKKVLTPPIGVVSKKTTPPIGVETVSTAPIIGAILAKNCTSPAPINGDYIYLPYQTRH